MVIGNLVICNMLMRNHLLCHGPVTRYVELRIVYAAGMPEPFFFNHPLQRKSLVSNPSIHGARAVKYVGITNPRWRGKRSRCMSNPRFYLSGKRPMLSIFQMTGGTTYAYFSHSQKHDCSIDRKRDLTLTNWGSYRTNYAEYTSALSEKPITW